MPALMVKMDARADHDRGITELAVGSTQQEKPIEMEVRIARLESDVAHLRTDVAEIKGDVRGLRARMDERIDRLEEKFDGRFEKFDGKFDTIAAKLDRLNDGISTAKISGLLLYFALAGTMLGVMARGFGWI
jgi:hypothetical protein